MPIALDTNVLVYAFDPDEGTKHERARSIVESAARAPLRLPLQVVNETFSVLIGRRWSKADARAALERLVKYLPVAHGTLEDSLRAMMLCDRHSLAYWDALIVATSAASGCGALLTEDLQDGRAFAAQEIGRVLRIVNPFNDENRAFLEMAGVCTDRNGS